MTANEGPRRVVRQPLPAPVGGLPSPPDRGIIVLVVSGTLTLGDIPAICERARALLVDCDAEQVVCDVGALEAPDAVAIDVLARLQLTAGRLGRRIRLDRACDELEELLELMGLGEVLPCGPSSGIEARGQPEEREQALRVEEEADPGDPAV
jgi:ABC-type transporter Mla MlaB component